VTKLWAFLDGKKTYIGAAALLLVAVAGLWFGQLDASGAASSPASLFLVGLGHKAQKYSELLIAQTEALKKTGHIDQKALIEAAVSEAVDRASQFRERRIFD
jgi:hypothetical protein